MTEEALIKQPLTPALSRKGRGGAFVKFLRGNMTDAERMIWNRIKNRQLEGAKFRRQAMIDRYIVDFACFEKKIIVEIDGGQHDESRKDAYLAAQRFKVIRFWNNDVLANTSGVLLAIDKAINAATPPTPDPSPPQAGGGE